MTAIDIMRRKKDPDFRAMAEAARRTELKMDISLTDFKAHCLDLVRQIEKSGKPITILRRGRVVARLEPATTSRAQGGKPWEQLRALGGRAHNRADESVW